MGCDIHPFIDYDDFITREGEPWVSCFAGRVDLGRNYTLFALMAGVRYDENRMDGKLPLFEPRGLPANVSWKVREEYYRFIEDDSTWERAVSSTDAERWVKAGYSTYSDDEKYVSGPDWHSASWLNADELELVSATYAQIKSPESSWYQSSSQTVPDGARITGKNRWGDIHVEVGEVTTLGRYTNLDAIIAAMRVLDGGWPGRSRLVFWFDN